MYEYEDKNFILLKRHYPKN